jgi:hypothetical protein
MLKIPEDIHHYYPRENIPEDAYPTMGRLNIPEDSVLRLYMVSLCGG